MRRVVYYTERGNRTPKFEDAKTVGIKRMALLDIPSTISIPNNRKVALENLKKGLTFC